LFSKNREFSRKYREFKFAISFRSESVSETTKISAAPRTDLYSGTGSSLDRGERGHRPSRHTHDRWRGLRRASGHLRSLCAARKGRPRRRFDRRRRQLQGSLNMVAGLRSEWVADLQSEFADERQNSSIARATILSFGASPPARCHFNSAALVPFFCPIEIAQE
jgi:hypothetical protein